GVGLEHLVEERPDVVPRDQTGARGPGLAHSSTPVAGNGTAPAEARARSRGQSESKGSGLGPSPGIPLAWLAVVRSKTLPAHGGLPRGWRRTVYGSRVPRPKYPANTGEAPPP